MQQELETENPSTRIRLLGVNAIGAELGNTLACDGRDLPWLQDTLTDNVTDLWSPTFRDVVILDENNIRVATYNLTANDLAVQANYDTLKALLKQAAGE